MKGFDRGQRNGSRFQGGWGFLVGLVVGIAAEAKLLLT